MAKLQMTFRSPVFQSKATVSFFVVLFLSTLLFSCNTTNRPAYEGEWKSSEGIIFSITVVDKMIYDLKVTTKDNSYFSNTQLPGTYYFNTDTKDIYKSDFSIDIKYTDDNRLYVRTSNSSMFFIR